MKRAPLGLALALGVVASVAIAAPASHDLVPVTGPALAGTTGTLTTGTTTSGAPPSSSTLALAALDRRIADLDAEEDVSKRELSELGTKIAEAHLRALGSGRAFYRLTRAGMLPVGGG